MTVSLEASCRALGHYFYSKFPRTLYFLTFLNYYCLHFATLDLELNQSFTFSSSQPAKWIPLKIYVFSTTAGAQVLFPNPSTELRLTSCPVHCICVPMPLNFPFFSLTCIISGWPCLLLGGIVGMNPITSSLNVSILHLYSNFPSCFKGTDVLTPL